MPKYEVVLHTHIGRYYVVEAANEDDAVMTAVEEFSEHGDDGDTLYDDIDHTEVNELKEG